MCADLSRSRNQRVTCLSQIAASNHQKVDFFDLRKACADQLLHGLAPLPETAISDFEIFWVFRVEVEKISLLQDLAWRLPLAGQAQLLTWDGGGLEVGWTLASAGTAGCLSTRAGGEAMLELWWNTRCLCRITASCQRSCLPSMS